MLRASIDLGTNTCLLLVADWPAGAAEPRATLADEAHVVRLGQGVDRDRRLSREAMDRAIARLKEYVAQAKGLGVPPGEIVAVATSQARDAANREEFFAEALRKAGVRLRCLTGPEEARATFVGALLPGMDASRSAVIDIGGGSTELATDDAGGLSLDMGAVRFTERHLGGGAPELAVTDEQFWACRAAVDAALAASPRVTALSARRAELGWVAVAGTATTLAAWHLGLRVFDRARIDGVELTRGDVHRMVEELKWRTPYERCLLPGVEPGRADVLLAGALILWRTLEAVGAPSARVSTRGLRYGMLRLASAT